MEHRRITSTAVMCALGVLCAGTGVWAGPANAGCDLLKTIDTNSRIVFGGPDQPCIPTDFFGPGSDPFCRSVDLEGVPLGGSFGDADTVVERQDDATFATNGSCTAVEPFCASCTPGSCAVVDIEVIAMSLKGGPLAVRYNGNTSVKLFEMTVGLAPTPSLGSMRVVHENATGGTYVAEMEVFVELTFTEVGNPTNQFTLEANQRNDCRTEGRWTHDPSFDGFADTCGDGSFNVTQSCIHDGPHRVNSFRPLVPTVSEWGVVVLVLLGMTIGTIVYWRTRHGAACSAG